MRLELVKAPRGIAPATEQDEERLRLVRVGDLLPVQLPRRPRNGKHHRLLWALVRFLAQNHPRLQSEQAVMLELKIRAGHYVERITSQGEIIFVPKSIAYDEMEQTEFAAFYTRAFQVTVTELLPDLPPDELNRYLERVTAFA